MYVCMYVCIYKKKKSHPTSTETSAKHKTAVQQLLRHLHEESTTVAET